jgi:hypothetical protein
MYAEAKGDHLERVSLLSAGLAPSVKYVPAEVEVTQVRFGGAQGLEVREHVAQDFGDGLKDILALAE